MECFEVGGFEAGSAKKGRGAAGLSICLLDGAGDAVAD